VGVTPVTGITHAPCPHHVAPCEEARDWSAKGATMQREQLRKFFFRLGWAILIVLPIAFIAEIVLSQDLPPVQPWKWAILFGAVALIYATRNRDDVLRHHVV
jgi:hypothetical protein